jgi:hypothetical protein
MIVIMDGYVNCVVNKCKLKMNICEKEEDLKKKSIPTPGIEPGPPA